jgi:starch phosphorylase
MKLALNGALTIGTLDGATIEIRDAVGPENLYIFGLRAEQVADLRASGAYDSRALYESTPRIRRVIDALGSGRFSPDEPRLFAPLVESLIAGGDRWFVLADFDSYGDTQERISRDWLEPLDWARRATLNVARMGFFSSDRAIREYATAIWNLKPVPG